MKAVIYRVSVLDGLYPEAVLTDEHEAAGPGVVLVLAGTPYGPEDGLPTGVRARTVVERFLDEAPPGIRPIKGEGGAEWGERNVVALDLARAFMGWAPYGRPVEGDADAVDP